MTQALVVAAAFAADRASKAWAMRSLAPRPSVELLPFLRLTYVENTGAAFGVFQDSNRFFIVLSVAMLAGLAWVRWTWRRETDWRVYALALVAAGALGNLYDRLVFGHVIDFIDFRVWPVFNVADSCISVGAAALALLLGKGRRESAA